MHSGAGTGRVACSSVTKLALSFAALSLLASCGRDSSNGTASTTPGAGGFPGGSSGSGGTTSGAAGQGGTVGVGGTGVVGGGNGGVGGGVGGAGVAGQSGAGTGGQSGGMSGQGGVAGASGGAGGKGGMCPDFQAGFAGGPAVPVLAPEGPSCAGGLMCGSRSCCESIHVPGGALHMGTDCAATCDPDSVCPPPFQDGFWPGPSPEIDEQIADFNLDTFPVTVGRFRKFVAAYAGTPPVNGAGTDPQIGPSGWRKEFDPFLLPTADALRATLICETQEHPGLATWTDAPGPNENKPINCVDWFHAFAFCIWDGGWLPIESTWEYAAAGGAEDRMYPWGEPLPDATRVANTCAFGVNGTPCDATMLPDVGSRPAGSGKWGHLDLIGYFAQWMQDARHYYPPPFDKAPNCAQGPECFVALLTTGAPPGMLMVRGYGGFLTPGPSWYRWMNGGNTPHAWLGVRCAR